MGGMYDISGLDDILGELMEAAGDDDSSGDDQVVLGREEALAVLGEILSGAKKKKGGGLQAAIRARKFKGAQVLSPMQPSSSGVQALGFNQAGVAAGTQATITTQPQTWFKPMRLVIGESIAPFFTVDNIIVGNKSQFPASTSLPGEGFIPQAEAVVMDLATVNPALNLTLLVTNISGVPQNFRAMFVGKEITP